MSGCDSGHCVTCADEAVPLRVEAVLPDGLAACEGGVAVMTDLIAAPVSPGDVLLVHAGVALHLAESPQEVPR